MKEILWCSTHDKSALFGQVVEERRICSAGFADNLAPCRVESRLLVDPDAPSFAVYWNNEGWAILNQTPEVPAGRYIFVGEA